MGVTGSVVAVLPHDARRNNLRPTECGFMVVMSSGAELGRKIERKGRTTARLLQGMEKHFSCTSMFNIEDREVNFHESSLGH